MLPLPSSNQIKLGFILLALLNVLAPFDRVGLCQTVNPPAKQSPRVKMSPTLPSGLRLCQLAPLGKAPLLIGGTINYPMLNSSAEIVLNREFQFITPGNAFKQTTVHPQPGKWNWRKADAWVDRCEERGQIMRLHACVSPQCSAWVEEDHRTPQELLENMEEYVQGICERYADRAHIRWLDVVNETVTTKGDWFGPKPGVGKWQNPWTQIGTDKTHPLKPPLYIEKAFEIADRYAPKIQLLYIQHGGMETKAWDRVKATVLYLKEKGLRVDGIGWQGHINTGFEKDPNNMRQLNNLIDWAHDNDLEFHVTENTVWVRGDDTLEEQAETFAAIVTTLLQHSKQGFVSWNAWQMRDQDPQRGELQATLFDRQGNPKPAYYRVQRVLANEKSTGE